MAEKHENLWISALKDWICDKYVIFLLLLTCLLILKDTGIFSNLIIKILGKDKLVNPHLALISDHLWWLALIIKINIVAMIIGLLVWILFFI